MRPFPGRAGSPRCIPPPGRSVRRPSVRLAPRPVRGGQSHGVRVGVGVARVVRGAVPQEQYLHGLGGRGFRLRLLRGEFEEVQDVVGDLLGLLVVDAEQQAGGAELPVQFADAVLVHAGQRIAGVVAVQQIGQRAVQRDRHQAHPLAPEAQLLGGQEVDVLEDSVDHGGEAAVQVGQGEVEAAQFGCHEGEVAEVPGPGHVPDGVVGDPDGRDQGVPQQGGGGGLARARQTAQQQRDAVHGVVTFPVPNGVGAPRRPRPPGRRLHPSGISRSAR